jgi:hypothetical protein
VIRQRREAKRAAIGSDFPELKHGTETNSWRENKYSVIDILFKRGDKKRGKEGSQRNRAGYAYQAPQHGAARECLPDMRPVAKRGTELMVMARRRNTLED